MASEFKKKKIVDWHRASNELHINKDIFNVFHFIVTTISRRLLHVSSYCSTNAQIGYRTYSSRGKMPQTFFTSIY